MGATRTCFVFIICQLIYVISAQEMVKRVPQGFVGMRGKKYTDSAELDHLFKRKPQFFVGVKGKKTLFNHFDQDIPFYDYKRAPMGFVGMRGKKDFLSEDGGYYPENYDFPKTAGSLIGQIDYSTNEDLKNPDTSPLNALLSEYLRKLESSNAVDSELDLMPRAEEEVSDEHVSNEVDKRAANIHQFFGVRGKKSIQNKRPYDLTFRGKFIGVRGKKDAKNNDMQELKFLLDQNAPWPKRKTQMGFFGMRGKKWSEESSSETGTSN